MRIKLIYILLFLIIFDFLIECEAATKKKAKKKPAKKKVAKKKTTKSKKTKTKKAKKAKPKPKKTKTTKKPTTPAEVMYGPVPQGAMSGPVPHFPPNFDDFNATTEFEQDSSIYPTPPNLEPENPGIQEIDSGVTLID